METLRVAGARGSLVGSRQTEVLGDVGMGLHAYGQRELKIPGQRGKHSSVGLHGYRKYEMSLGFRDQARQ